MELCPSLENRLLESIVKLISEDFPSVWGLEKKPIFLYNNGVKQVLDISNEKYSYHKTIFWNINTFPKPEYGHFWQQ